jgi:hypothetical protein
MTSGMSLDDVRDLVRPDGPVASVYLAGPSPGPGDSEEDLLLRLRAIIAELHTHGADPETVDVVDTYLSQTLNYPTELALLAASGRIRAAQQLPGGVPQDLARYGAPAAVGPVLAWLQGHPAHLVVVTDRTGADITTVPTGAVQARTRTVVGPDDEIERNSPGGWSQPRFQRRAEDSWLHNASAVADAITAELAAVHGRLVILAGDVRACQLLSDRLARTGVPPVIRHVSGGRSPDGSAAHRQAAVLAAVQEYAAEQVQAVRERFIAARGPHGIAVSGSRATMSALAAGRVGTLLIVDDTADDRGAWFGADGWCTSDPAEPRPPGTRRGRLVDVAIRSALLGHAEVCVLPPEQAFGLADGLAALCRYR